MTKHTLAALPRKVSGRKVKTIRRENQIPANVFGKRVKSQNLQVETKTFLKLYQQAGESTLVYLKIQGEKEELPTMISDVQFHPLSSLPLHVSFHQVDLKEKVTAPIKIKLVGESLAVKDSLGVLVQQLDEIEVEALPADMPENIELDISSLAVVDAALSVKDVRLDSAKFTVKTDPESIIVKIEPLAKEEVVAPPPAADLPPAAPAEEGTPAKTETPPPAAKE
jgi:large subunit ribosomal protein L25